MKPIFGEYGGGGGGGSMTARTAKLIVDTNHSAVRIEVLDARYQVRAKGYGRIEKELPTGLYTVRYVAGDVVKEKDITLRPGKDLVLDGPPELPIASAAPLELTSTSHEYHQGNAHWLSHAQPYGWGDGAQLFVFVRDVEEGGADHPASGLSLRRLNDGNLLPCDTVFEASTDSAQARWAGRNIAVDPGIYFLRLELSSEEAIEMPLVACPGWQSQVFLLRQGGGSEAAGQAVLDFSSATQFLTRIGSGFDARRMRQGAADWEEGGDLRLAELTRQALAHGRKGLRTRDLQQMLDGKWNDPLLGIFGVHLLLLREKPDLALARHVVERLRHELFPGFRHPDVEALALELTRRAGKPIQAPPFEAPPMLLRSWQMLLRATAEQPSLIAPRSLAARIADRLWGSGAWLIWQVPPDLPAQPQADSWFQRWRESGLGQELQASFEEFSDGITLRSASSFRHGPRLAEAMKEESQNKEGLLQWMAEFGTNLARLGFAELLEALEALLPRLEGLLKHVSIEVFAQEADLDSAEFALFVRLEGILKVRLRRSSATERKPLTLATLVNQLGLPAERVQRAMGSLILKLLGGLGTPPLNGEV